MSNDDGSVTAGGTRGAGGYLVPIAWARAVARRWLLPALCLLAMFLLMRSIFHGVRNTVWCYYTDDISIREEHDEVNVRRVLWEDPHPLFAKFDSAWGRHEASFSPDETRIVLTRGLEEGTNADLYVSRWVENVWQEPVPLDEVNSDANEAGAAWDPKGKCLYFVSDREGGHGGYDIWVARRNGGGWAGITNLGSSVNSRGDEFGPMATRDGKYLYFSSDRPGTKKQDIFRAERVALPEPAVPVEKPPAKPQPGPRKGKTGGKGRKTARPAPAVRAHAPLAAVPVFKPAERVEALCSRRDDLKPQVSARGDFIYLASNRRGGHGGFDIYWSRVLNDQPLEPENLGREINSDGDDTGPALRMEGYDLMFSSNRGSENEEVLSLYSTTMREVIPGLDMSRWYRLMALLERIKWWLMLLIIAAIILVYLIKHYKDLTSLKHKCIMASVILHVLLLLIMAFWMISREFLEEKQAPKSVETAINVDSLAQEKLALDMQDDVAELPPSDVSVLVEQAQPDVPMPEFTPTSDIQAPPVVTRTVEKSLVHRVTPSKARTATATIAKAADLDQLPTVEITEMAVLMEMPELEEQTDTVEVNEFSPNVMQEEVTVEHRVEYKKPAPKAVSTVLSSDLAKDVPTDAADGGPEVRGTDGNMVVASAGLETKGSLPKLTGVGDVVGLLIKSPGMGRRLRMNAPGKLDVPAGRGTGISPHILKYPGKLSTEVVESLGGGAETQHSVGRALDWFTRHQEEDGHWDLVKHGGEKGHDIAGTALTLLCYFGWGAKHTEPGPHQEAVKKALDWLVGRMKEGGDFYSATGAGNGMYDQGMATIALSEAWGMTGDKRLGEAATNAVDFIIKAQDPATGGWRYKPRSGSDTSVFGWQYMALHSAKLAGIEIEEKVFKKARKWLDQVGGGTHGGLYGYNAPGGKRPAIVATGMFCRQLDMVKPTEPEMLESALYLKGHPLNAAKPDMYYTYYGTLALYQHQGEIWEEWNERMKEILTDLQIKTGENAGSWDVAGGHGNRMGRVVSTAICTLSLEVYYRILPIYGIRPSAEEAEEAEATQKE